MPKAVLDLTLCDPNQCASGACVARKQCPVKAIFQEAPFETPFLSPDVCRGCSRCVAVCPGKAIRLG